MGNKIMLFICGFLLIFNFKVPFIYNSIILSGVLSTVSLLILHKRVTLRKKELLIPFIFTVLGLYISLYVYFSETGDYTRIDSVVSNLIVYVIVLLSIKSFGEVKTENKLLYFSNFLLAVFTAQSLIIILSFFSSEFHAVIRLFQLSSDSIRSEHYQGVRGLALSGAQFFPTSALFAIAQVLISYTILIGKRFCFIKMLLLIMIGLAGMTTGRTAIIGTVISFFIFFISSFKNKEIAKSIIKLVLFSLAFYFSISFLSNFISSNLLGRINDYFLFAFEFVDNYLTTGEIETSSTNILSRMYWSLDSYRFILGYGRYTNDDGTTFMYTDGGYMRDMLLLGISGTLIIFIMNSIIVYKIYHNCRFYPYSKIIFFSLWLVTNVLHYKGGVLMHLISVQTLLFILYAMTIESKKEYKSEIGY